MTEETRTLACGICDKDVQHATAMIRGRRKVWVCGKCEADVEVAEASVDVCMNPTEFGGLEDVVTTGHDADPFPAANQAGVTVPSPAEHIIDPEQETPGVDPTELKPELVCQVCYERGWWLRSDGQPPGLMMCQKCWLAQQPKTEEPADKEARPARMQALFNETVEAMDEAADERDLRIALLECERRLHRRNRFGSFLGDALAALLVLLVAATLAAAWYRWVWLRWVAH